MPAASAARARGRVTLVYRESYFTERITLHRELLYREVQFTERELLYRESCWTGQLQQLRAGGEELLCWDSYLQGYLIERELLY